MRYANHECTGCGKLLPADELSRETYQAHSGTSRTERRIGRTPFFRHSSTTRHVSNRAGWMCFSCRAKRFLGWSAVLGGAYLWATLSEPDDPGERTTSQATGVIATVEQLAETVQGAAARSTMAAKPDDPVRSDGGAPGEAVAALPPQQTPTLAATDLLQEDRVQRAIAIAAASGKPRRWHVLKLRGYAVPSEAAADGCRMVQVSIDDGERLPASRECPTAQAEADQ